MLQDEEDEKPLIPWIPNFPFTTDDYEAQEASFLDGEEDQKTGEGLREVLLRGVSGDNNLDALLDDQTLFQELQVKLDQFYRFSDTETPQAEDSDDDSAAETENEFEDEDSGPQLRHVFFQSVLAPRFWDDPGLSEALQELGGRRPTTAQLGLYFRTASSLPQLSKALNHDSAVLTKFFLRILLSTGTEPEEETLGNSIIWLKAMQSVALILRQAVLGLQFLGREEEGMESCGSYTFLRIWDEFGGFALLSRAFRHISLLLDYQLRVEEEDIETDPDLEAELLPVSELHLLQLLLLHLARIGICFRSNSLPEDTEARLEGLDDLGRVLLETVLPKTRQDTVFASSVHTLLLIDHLFKSVYSPTLSEKDSPATEGSNWLLQTAQALLSGPSLVPVLNMLSQSIIRVCNSFQQQQPPQQSNRRFGGTTGESISSSSSSPTFDAFEWILQTKLFAALNFVRVAFQTPSFPDDSPRQGSLAERFFLTNDILVFIEIFVRLITDSGVDDDGLLEYFRQESRGPRKDSLVESRLRHRLDDLWGIVHSDRMLPCRPADRENGILIFSGMDRTFLNLPFLLDCLRSLLFGYSLYSTEAEFHFGTEITDLLLDTRRDFRDRLYVLPEAV